MKAIQNIGRLLLIIFLLVNCANSKKSNKDQENQNEKLEESQGVDPLNAQNFVRCSTMEVLEKHMIKTPDLKSRMESVENHCRAFIAQQKENRVVEQLADSISIPVIIHVIYNTELENISDAQIQSQIEVLNEDFNKNNEDVVEVPDEFKPIIADINISFSIDSIIRKPSTRAEWGTNDQMKFSSSGGSDVITPDTHLNMWICTIGGGILGYAQFPGDSKSTDGIVITPQFFGTTGSVVAPFDKGRTTTHEVGHWLNLRHIWGDGNCDLDDFVADTPLSDAPNYGCPQYPSIRCGSNDNTMNYMDYTDDACMHMFTEGQKERMVAVFATGGPRESFIK